LLIDEIIKQVEYAEKMQQPVGQLAFLWHLEDLTSKGEPLEGKQIRLMFLTYGLNRLLLILRRLRETVKVSRLESQYSKILVYAEIDAESFFHYVYSILSAIARLNQYFYQPPPNYFPPRSFTEQRTYFIGPKLTSKKKVVPLEDRRNTDLEYSQYLKDNTGWYDDFIEYRKCITHFSPAFFASKETGLEMHILNEKTTSVESFPIIKVPDYMNETANNLFRPPLDR
jgi:hypothetical protein